MGAVGASKVSRRHRDRRLLSPVESAQTPTEKRRGEVKLKANRTKPSSVSLERSSKVSTSS